ncbi:MAG: CoA pyrophosphatase, partial [Ilumatobacteraceae bacterium]
MTRRSQELTNHRGEISFPGGRLEIGETPVDAA